MAGINSLGIGSGVLTADVLDQLREADDNVILKPIETKMELNNQKQEASNLLSGYMSTFKQSTSALGNQNLYLGREVSGSNDDVTIVASDGADITSFNLTDISKAEKDVWKSTASFTDKTTALSNLSSGVLTIMMDNEEYEVTYDASDSIDDIRQSINDQAGDVMTATVLQIGADDYELVITAKDTNKAISFYDSNAYQVDTITLADDNLETADKFSLTLNGETFEYEVKDGDDIDDVNRGLAALANDFDFGDGEGNTFTFSASSNGEMQINAKDYNSFTSSATVVTNPNGIASASSSNDPIYQVDTITLADDNLEDGDIFKLTLNGIDFEYTADVTGGDTLDTINDQLASLASVYDFGNGAGNSFTFSTSAGGIMTITSQELGSFTSTVSSDTNPNGTTTTDSSSTPGKSAGSLASALGLDNIQVAKGATFNFNGIAITRDDNTIDDLINGVTITLNQNQETNESASIKIGQSETAIKTEMDLLVTNFNLLASNLRDMTVYDDEKGVAGIFQSENTIKNILRDMTRILSKVDNQGNSLYDYGLEIDRDGVMSLDSTKFSAKLAEDPIALEKFFRGSSEVDPIRQLDTITLSSAVGTGDTFTWSDGTNSISLNEVDGDLVFGETAEESAARIAQAINDDTTLSALYIATASGNSFTIESRKAGLEFSGTAESTGLLTSSQENTVRASKNSTVIPEVVGIFKELDNKMYSYTGASQILSAFDDKLGNLRESLISEYDKQKESLNTRYETLTKKFAAYDSVINKLNNQFASLKSMIDAESDN